MPTDKDKSQEDENTPPGEGGEGGKEKNPPEPKDKKSDGDKGESDDEPKIPEDLKPYIAKLRKENADYRTKNKELNSKFSDLNTKFSKMDKAVKKLTGAEEDKELDPDELETSLVQEKNKNQALELRSSILEIAIDNGIGNKDAVDYLGHLIEKSAAEMEDGEELDEAKVAELVKKVKAVFSKSASTSVEGEGKGKETTPDPDKKSSVTVEQFSRMSISERSLLYQKNAELYNQLMQTAKEKRLFV